MSTTHSTSVVGSTWYSVFLSASQTKTMHGSIFAFDFLSLDSWSEQKKVTALCNLCIKWFTLSLFLSDAEEADGGVSPEDQNSAFAGAAFPPPAHCSCYLSNVEKAWHPRIQINFSARTSVSMAFTGLFHVLS